MQRQSDKYRPTQSLESKVLLHELLHEPDEFRTHLQRYTASVIVTVTYGRRVEDVRTDIVVQRNNESVDRFVSVNIPGKFAVERYPILKYIPAFLAPWKADVLRQRQKDIQLYTQLLDEVKEKVARGVAHDCWTTQLLAQQEELQMKDIEIAYTAGGSFAAGVETVCICSCHNPPGIHPTHVRHLVCKHSLKLFLGLRQIRQRLHPQSPSRTGQSRGNPPSSHIRRPPKSSVCPGYCSRDPTMASGGGAGRYSTRRHSRRHV